MSVDARIPLADAASFRRRASRQGFLRLALALALLATGALVLAAGLGLRASETTPLPPSSGGIVVLDVSASISSETYARIAGTLQRLVRSDGRYGLVLFSDTAYQALPPNTSARELRPYVRFFAVPERTGPGALPTVPRSPWTDSFSGGTRISTGLALALDVIRRERLDDPAVLLVSDLDDDTADLDRVTELAVAYRRADIPLHVIGLNPAPEDVAFVQTLVTRRGSFTRASLPSEGTQRGGVSVDRTLVVAPALLAGLFAVSSILSLRLGWRSRP